jgi:hypothetical protein
VVCLQEGEYHQDGHQGLPRQNPAPKKRNQHIMASRTRRTILLALRPVFVLTADIRPRLLVATALAERKGTIVFGVLIHRRRQAFQSRLRFDYPTVHQETLRATRWTPLPDPETFARYLAQVKEGFATMAVALGGQASTVEFAPDASDDDMLAALHASGILEILGVPTPEQGHDGPP